MIAIVAVSYSFAVYWSGRLSRSPLAGESVMSRAEVAVSALARADRIQIRGYGVLPPSAVRVRLVRSHQELGRLGEGPGVQGSGHRRPALRPAVRAVPRPPERP